MGCQYYTGINLSTDLIEAVSVQGLTLKFENKKEILDSKLQEIVNPFAPLSKVDFLSSHDMLLEILKTNSTIQIDEIKPIMIEYIDSFCSYNFHIEYQNDDKIFLQMVKSYLKLEEFLIKYQDSSKVCNKS